MVQVIKATGTIEQFDENKLKNSIERAHIHSKLQNQIVAHVHTKLYENIPTSKIYHHVQEFLETGHPYAKARYGLKQAIMDLGPTGYPFEDYVSEILKQKGYETKVRQILHGKCITHEIDVVARKQSEKVMIEAKFHNSYGVHTDTHVVLYTKARFNDVLEKNDLNSAWIITNTKATSDAVTYALCVGMRVISWSYPDGQSLRDIIEVLSLQPITTLTTLSRNQKQTLLLNHIVLCKSICQNISALDCLNIDHNKKQQILEEIKHVCVT